MSLGIDPAPSGVSYIADLATKLHDAGKPHLRIELPAGQVQTEVDLPIGCRLSEGAIEFESLDARNAVVAATAYDRLHTDRGIDADALFERAYELWRHEIGHSDQASGRLLGLASGTHDVLALGAQRIRSGLNVVGTLRLVEEALPYLSTLEVASIIDLSVAAYEASTNGVMAGTVNGALRKWLENRPDSARDLHTRALKCLSEATADLLGIAIVALSKSDYASAVELAMADARSDMPLQARTGTWALGLLLGEEQAPPEAINHVAQAVTDLVGSDKQEIRSQAIKAAVGAMHNLAAFDALLYGLAEIGDQEVLRAAATALFLKDKAIRERGTTERWLRLLVQLKPEFAEAIQNLDYAMSRLLSEPGYAAIVVSTLSQWVANHGQHAPIDSITVGRFDDTIRKLVRLGEIWASVVTDWLLSDCPQHAAALAGILNQLGADETTDIRLDKGRLDALSTDDLLFLARRILGYVHDRAQVTALALSMLQSNDAQTRLYPLLHALLVEEIGYDYPHSTVSALRKAAEELSASDSRAFLLTTADEISQAADAQSALPTINELQPSATLRRLFSRARAKQMQHSFEEASKNSLWRQIAAEIPIKAGAATFSYRASSYGPSMRLAPLSHSIEIPRREAFDPIGNSIRHIGFRLAKRGGR